MSGKFQGKRALVTGAGKGIGREIVGCLAREGAEVVALSRTAADLKSLEAETGCRTITVDLSQAAEARRAAEEAGDIDLLVNNAGISILEPFLTTSRLVISQVMAGKLIARKKPGAIVNLSSQGSMVGLRDHASYCSSKGALDQLTRVMALELGPHKIRVNAVNPTVVLTPMGEMAWSDPAKAAPMLARIPIGRFAKPVDVAEAVLFLLSDEAAMIHGVMLPVDGGFLAG
jgi:NAD(P)-dependent dehydrogenase (short-subunit alcohol dehydrogenase family)